MFRSFHAVLQPIARQADALARLLEAQRELYNAALQERVGAWRWERRSVSRFEQFRALTGWDHGSLAYGISPARGTLTRLDRAFQGFYRRCRTGQTPGFPRFKSRDRFDSVDYPEQSSWRITDDHDGVGRLYLKGIGTVRFSGSKRGVRGAPRTITIRREGNRWRLTIFCAAVPGRRLEPTAEQVGIDLGVTALVATSDGDVISNPRHLRRSLGALARRQRLVAGRRPGSARRRRAAAKVGELHRKVARQRRNLAHVISRRLVDSYDVIVHEDLKIANMVRRPAPRPNDEGGFDPSGAAAKAALNREILAAGWGQLLRCIAYKAEEAGREIIAVNPRHTSQTCHHCGHVDAENRHAGEFRCTSCGHQAHADVNAARNILRAGQARRHEREANVAA